jgi:hypothetical protein
MTLRVRKRLIVPGSHYRGAKATGGLVKRSPVMTVGQSVYVPYMMVAAAPSVASSNVDG